MQRPVLYIKVDVSDFEKILDAAEFKKFKSLSSDEVEAMRFDRQKIQRCAAVTILPFTYKILYMIDTFEYGIPLFSELDGNIDLVNLAEFSAIAQKLNKVVRKY